MVDLQLVFSLANVFGTIGTAALGVYGGIRAGERINQIEEISREEKNPDCFRGGYTRSYLLYRHIDICR